GIELGPTVFIFGEAVFVQAAAALIAVGRAEVILAAAAWTVGGELAAGHRDEWPVRAVDDFQIANDKAVVEGDRAECLQALAGLFHELDADLGDFHGRSPYELALIARSAGIDATYTARLQSSCDPACMPSVTANAKVTRSTAAHLR